MWQSLLLKHHYNFCPDVDSHSQLSILKYPLPQFCNKISYQIVHKVLRKIIENLL